MGAALPVPNDGDCKEPEPRDSIAGADGSDKLGEAFGRARPKRGAGERMGKGAAGAVAVGFPGPPRSAPRLEPRSAGAAVARGASGGGEEGIEVFAMLGAGLGVSMTGGRVGAATALGSGGRGFGSGAAAVVGGGVGDDGDFGAGGAGSVRAFGFCAGAGGAETTAGAAAGLARAGSGAVTSVGAGFGVVVEDCGLRVPAGRVREGSVAEEEAFSATDGDGS